MTISYNWLSSYLPENIEPEKLSKILTSVGLEVESLEKFESLKGGLQGLLVAEVLTCEKHPDADKLKITTVNIGSGNPLQVVCGAPNVAVGQKVILAPIGTTIYPVSSETPLTMKKAKIRGVESEGMICAEDEIGIGESHDGILVLPADTVAGTPAADIFKPYNDWIFEIGLTPNRMDAMSHLGVARDVCAYLAHHNKKHYDVKTPLNINGFKVDNTNGPKFSVEIENINACRRYCGIAITGVKVAESPEWLKNYLGAIGVRSINNIVDITNFILHETGQPLHAFDGAKIAGNKVIVKNLPAGTPFVTLDGKERLLHEDDLLICDGNGTPMCIAGIFGGLGSGVTESTSTIFLESAFFDAIVTRKSSYRHGLRTDAATRFEKGVDIGNTLSVLKRAALLIKEIAGGELAGDIIDVLPTPLEKKVVSLKFHYLKKLSGKNYHPDTVRQILNSLGFTFIKEGTNDLWFDVPFSKPDVSLPADLVEEIMRIDGLDNVEIPSSIQMSPSPDINSDNHAWKNKVADTLAASGFNEIFTNSITNSKYYDEDILKTVVKMINNLSVDLDIMRPAMLESGLEVINHNINRRNLNLRLFEFGKTYYTSEIGKYTETNHLSLYVTGLNHEPHWRAKAEKADFYFLKGIVSKLLQLLGLSYDLLEPVSNENFDGVVVNIHRQPVITMGIVKPAKAAKFDVKQQVLFADILWDNLVNLAKKNKISYSEVSKYPAVERDLALLVNKSVTYAQIKDATKKAKINKLTKVNLFDVFESEKIGADKKSMAVSFTFQDNEKTLLDKDIEGFLDKLIKVFTNELQAEIRM